MYFIPIRGMSSEKRKFALFIFIIASIIMSIRQHFSLWKLQSSWLAITPNQSTEYILSRSISSNDAYRKDGETTLSETSMTTSFEDEDLPFTKFTINNPSLCFRSKNLMYLLYFVTAPKNFERRQILRSTWASYDMFAERIFGRLFIVGQTNNATIQTQLVTEHETYQDILQGDFVDSYRNLSMKGIIALKWIYTYCRQAKFAIKADDDSFVNIHGLFHVLSHYVQQSRVIVGYLYENGTNILRDPETCNKFCAADDDFPGQARYPTYCSGILYSVSGDLIPAMYQAAKTTPIFWIEDVFMTGVLAAKVGNILYVNLHEGYDIDYYYLMKVICENRKPFAHIASQCGDECHNLWEVYSRRIKQEGRGQFIDHLVNETYEFQT